MEFNETTPFFRALATKYDPEREGEAIDLVRGNPEIATLQWPRPDKGGKPFVKGATLLHYAANDGKIELMKVLVEKGADVNASDAHWFRSVLSWAANNARLEAIRWLLDNGADPLSLDALHAAAWGGSSAGTDDSKDYPSAIVMLVEAGANLDEGEPRYRTTPLAVAIESGNERAVETIKRLGTGN